MTSPGHQLAAALDAVHSMEEQLNALYEEKAQVPTREALEETIASLDAQVCALLDERAELERRLAAAAAARPARAPALAAA